jgi:D-alanyl-D-alanine carboxypeptidase
MLLINNLEKLAVFRNLGKKIDYEFVSKNGNSYSTESTNKLIKTHSDLEAVKTGYTAGSLGSMISRLNFQGRQIILMVLNSPNRENDTLLLKDQIIQNFSLQ